jgi:hemolysin activation/secretion protein
MPQAAGAPFWALSALGGDRDVLAEVQALRGFVDSRFIDRNAFAGSVEARISALAFHLFATDLVFEPTPFVDFGKVFSQMSENPLSHPKVAGGFGVRMLAKPFVVGYVDVGFGSEGLVVFSGINYPF